MSVLQCDSFDGYVSSELGLYWSDQAIFGAASIGTPARTGVGAMRPSPGGVARNTGTLLFDAIVGAAFMTSGSGGPIFAFTQGIGSSGLANSVVQCQLVMLADGTVGVQQRANGAILATSDSSGAVLQSNVYSYVEWLTSFAAGGGLNQVYINGQLVLSAVVDTNGAPLPGANTVWLLGAGGGAANFFDDYYLVNPDDGTDLTTFAGDSSVICAISSANGDTNEWTPTPATNQNWQNVHQIPSSSGLLYNRSNGINTVDDYEVSPPLALTDKILAVQLMHRSFAEESGDLAEPFLNIQGTSYNDNAHLYEPSTAAYTPMFFIYERNPVSSGGLSPWTGVAFNGTNWGIGQIGHPVTFAVRLSSVHNVNQGNVTGVLTP